MYVIWPLFSPYYICFFILRYYSNDSTSSYGLCSKECFSRNIYQAFTFYFWLYIVLDFKTYIFSYHNQKDNPT